MDISAVQSIKLIRLSLTCTSATLHILYIQITQRELSLDHV